MRCAVLCCGPVLLGRFQWWRDALSNLSPNTAPPQHPVLTALWDTLFGRSNSSSKPGSVKSSSKASIYQLKRMLDAREQDLLDPQPPLGLKDLETYGEATASQLLYLQLGAAGELCVHNVTPTCYRPSLWVVQWVPGLLWSLGMPWCKRSAAGAKIGLMMLCSCCPWQWNKHARHSVGLTLIGSRPQRSSATAVILKCSHEYLCIHCMVQASVAGCFAGGNIDG